MRLRIASVLTALIALWTTGCATTSFVSTWKEPTATMVTPGPEHKVVAFVIHENEGTRRSAETHLAQEIGKSGVQVIPGYTLVSAEEIADKERVKQILKNAKVDGAVVMRVVGKDEQTTYVPGTTYYTTGYYPSFYGYYGASWGMVSTPGYMETDVIVSVETLLYSVTDDKLLWAGTSETTNPTKVDGFIHELVSAARSAMQKDGVLAK